MAATTSADEILFGRLGDNAPARPPLLTAEELAEHARCDEFGFLMRIVRALGHWFERRVLESSGWDKESALISMSFCREGALEIIGHRGKEKHSLHFTSAELIERLLDDPVALRTYVDLAEGRS